MPVKAGTIYKRFIANDKKTRVTLRAAKWEDLDDMVDFANGLVREQKSDPGFGTIIKGPVRRDAESEWLAKKLIAIERGDEISLVAEVEGRVVGNSEVIRGKSDEARAHGVLGISVSRRYRRMGIGTEIMRSLVKLSKDAGLKTLELQVLSTNPTAASVYEKVGFKRAGVIEKKIRRGGKVIDAVIMTKGL